MTEFCGRRRRRKQKYCSYKQYFCGCGVFQQAESGCRHFVEFFPRCTASSIGVAYSRLFRLIRSVRPLLHIRLNRRTASHSASSIVVLVRYRSHPFLSLDSSAHPIAATGGGWAPSPLATPAVSIVALLRCRLHRSVLTASSARLIAPLGTAGLRNPFRQPRPPLPFLPLAGSGLRSPGPSGAIFYMIIAIMT